MKTFVLSLSLLALAYAPVQAQTTATISILNIPALPLNAASTVTTTPAPTTPLADLPTVTTLPTAAEQIAGDYSVALQGPSRLNAGEATTWDFMLTNTGTAPIKLQHGACDVRFEVLNTAGEVVRPDPKNGICTLQLVYFEAQGGETQPVQSIRWDGKDAQGQAVPAGEYTIRAKYVGGGQFTPAATLTVRVQ